MISTTIMKKYCKSICRPLEIVSNELMSNGVVPVIFKKCRCDIK